PGKTTEVRPAEPTKTEAPTVKPTDKPTEPSTPEQTTEAPTETEAPFTPPVAKSLEAVPVLVSSHAKNDWYPDIRRNKYWVEWPQFSVLGQDRPAFTEAIEKWNLSADKSGLMQYTDNLEDARKGFSPAMNNWEDRTDAYVQRADEKIFSVLLESTSYHGGAHPGTLYSELNMDPGTGKTLGLSDVVQNQGSFIDKAVSLLTEQNKENGNPFWDKYEDTFRGLLQKKLGDNKTAGIAWVMLPDHLRLIVDEYVLAAYAYGPVYVDIPFYENETLFLKKDYYAAVNGSFKSFASNGKGGFNVSLFYEEPFGDYLVSVLDYPGEYYGDYEIWCGERVVKKSRGLGLTHAWLLTRGDQQFAIIQCSYENAYEETHVYRVGREKLEEVDTYYGAVIPVVNDPDHLLWEVRGDMLGSWTGYAKLTVTDAGQLKYDKTYLLNNKDDGFEEIAKRTLTTKREVKAFSVEDPKKEIRIPKGTELVPYETDFMSYMDVILPDGTFARIQVVRDKSTYSFLIDGVNEYDVFDGITYYS
ncbi:MAG: hypothetical protein J6Y95_01120, partial [Lachnospiraceae bacterium]|nr:hypothetical protein [Lachnospiraceae bacterium]